jgi:LacI family transcriptional regulator
MVDALDRLRGSHGVILKAQDEPEVAEVIDRLVDSGVPVVTYATDVPASARCAYVGIDNHGAGVTAAYLMGQWLGSSPSDVLITLGTHRHQPTGDVDRGKGDACERRAPTGARRGAVDDVDREIAEDGHPGDETTAHLTPPIFGSVTTPARRLAAK